jgi:hypothetical protein
MIILYSSRLINALTLGSRSVNGLAIFPFIIIRSEIRGTAEALFTINHERIHIRQQLELLLLPFTICYILMYLWGLMRGMSRREAYRNIIFEREAYRNMYNLEYLQERKKFSFLKEHKTKQQR